MHAANMEILTQERSSLSHIFSLFCCFPVHQSYVSFLFPILWTAGIYLVWNLAAVLSQNANMLSWCGSGLNPVEVIITARLELLYHYQLGTFQSCHYHSQKDKHITLAKLEQLKGKLYVVELHPARLLFKSVCIHYHSVCKTTFVSQFKNHFKLSFNTVSD